MTIAVQVKLSDRKIHEFDVHDIHFLGFLFDESEAHHPDKDDPDFPTKQFRKFFFKKMVYLDMGRLALTELGKEAIQTIRHAQLFPETNKLDLQEQEHLILTSFLQGLKSQGVVLAHRGSGKSLIEFPHPEELVFRHLGINSFHYVKEQRRKNNDHRQESAPN